MTTTDQATRERAQIRRANDHVIGMGEGHDGGHRDRYSSTIDYKLPEATRNAARASATTKGMTVGQAAFATGWHHHDCELQVGLVLEGSSEICVDPASPRRLGAGEVAIIMGGMRHEARYPSSDFRTVEITFPGDFNTIESHEPPPPGQAAPIILSPGAGVRVSVFRGLTRYVYPVPEAQSEKYALEREYHSSADPFEPGVIDSEDRYRLIYTIKGTRDLILDGESVQARPDDIVIIPRGSECRDVAISDEYESLVMRVRR